MLEGNSIDSIVTDPPYFLSGKNTYKTKKLLSKKKVNNKGFMNKEWDGGNLEVVEKENVPEELL